ncbi:MAG: type II toxin-antitoxin system Phd/YefM family antitoxin [Myxococcota bacterium]
MKSIAVSEFKAKCIGILKEVQRRREGVVVTLRGKPVAIVQPAPERGKKRLGALKGSMKLRRDLVRTSSSADWEMLR